MSTSNDLTRDRYAACVIGQCLGDATGFVVEGFPPKQCASYVNGLLRTGKAGAFGRSGFKYGQYTDDSQLMREMLQSYCDRGAFDAADYAARVAAIFEEGRIVGRGRATEQAAQRLTDGVPWDEAGTPPPSAGNGSAMRAAAAGMIVPAGGEALAAVAHDQGRITHADPRCSAGAVAVAAATARGLRGEPVDPVSFCDELSALMAPFDAGSAEQVSNLVRWCTLEPEDAVAPIAELGSQPEVGEPWAGISPFVTTSVLWSLYAFLRSPDDYWDAICTAIEVGGDVDTTAAMTGAISGAHLGMEVIPEELACRLTDNGSWGFDELTALSGRVCDLASAASS